MPVVQTPNETRHHIANNERARHFIAVTDFGGIPLGKAITNRIAESFGLEVSRSGPCNETIELLTAREKGAAIIPLSQKSA